MKFIVKLFPEIMVKGAPVKKKMITMLHQNLLTLLRRLDDSVELKKFRDKIEIYCDDHIAGKARKILSHTPGVEQYLEVIQYHTGEDLDLIAEKIAEHKLNLIDGKTFVVRAKRSGSHSVSSTEVERFVGSYLYNQGNPKGVDLKKPEVKVEFELHQNVLSIITRRVYALGGYPLGTQGEVLSLMSGGFDSTVASYLTIKRGMKTHFVFFNLGGAAHEVGVKQVALYLWSQFGASHRVKFVTVPFEDVVTEIFNSTHESYMGVTLKRLMLKAAEQVAEKMKIDALVTGEAVAQVSSQTLRNLALIDEASNKLVIRPLITMNKPDIISIAEQIGTREFSENMPEYCGVISKNPVIAGSFQRMGKEARKFNFDVLQQAIDQAVTISVDKIVEDVNAAAPVEIVSQPDKACVIDIRRPDEIIKQPLKAVAEVLQIPFDELNLKFKSLDQSKSYILFCDKGVMSQLHAQYLRDAGYENVKVYRPS